MKNLIFLIIFLALSIVAHSQDTTEVVALVVSDWQKPHVSTVRAFVVHKKDSTGVSNTMWVTRKKYKTVKAYDDKEYTVQDGAEWVEVPNYLIFSYKPVPVEYLKKD